MAEAKEDGPNFPPRGKVQEVRKQWSVHEDGALAYQMQNQEIDQHYGLNRYNRRMVRQDIPVAKIVQSEEEIRLQEERLRELAALRAQAEEDEKIAKRIEQQLKHESSRKEVTAAVDDEELARQLQEKEKKRYERHLEKKREKKLKLERQQLEAQLARDTEEARLVLNSDAGSDRVADSIENLSLQGVNATRVTPSGRIEDDGDFSDFYNLPPEMDELTRLEIQACQDEELARLLQEQEHKRTKAEVDQDKLRKIEQQDEQLARVMQEQEKLRLKKAKLKHQQKKEAQRKQSAESLPLGASANTFNQLRLQESPPVGASASVTVSNSSGGHNRYRRNSYTQAFDTPPSPPQTQPPAQLSSGKSNQNTSRHASAQSTVSAPGSVHNQQQYIKAQQQMAPPLASPQSSPRSAYIGPGGGMSTLESARRIAAGDPERILALQNSAQQNVINVQKERAGAQMERTAQRDISGNTMDIIRAHSHQGNPSWPVGSSVDPRRVQQTPAYALGPELRDSDDTEVLKWLSSQEGGAAGHQVKGQPHQYQPQQRRSGSGSYYSDEEDDPPCGSYPNGSAGFNIAAAIDPTYKRRYPDAAFTEETQLKTHIPFSRSLPQADGELEWDPGLRGSLRKTKAPLHGYQDPSGGGSIGQANILGAEPVMSVWQPVQGQRRTDGKIRNKSRKQNSAGGDKKDKGNCKQQ
ncbi:involucrin-like isoform X2 [Physella acuta]|uniref:involucrin-like isoform X2 n=1 Tax=Physella acuta TaxID=109671 RepID=UPI0027DE8372|nr:involucrin-like isoform X2 [Physella acuta]